MGRYCFVLCMVYVHFAFTRMITLFKVYPGDKLLRFFLIFVFSSKLHCGFDVYVDTTDSFVGGVLQYVNYRWYTHWHDL